MANNGSLVIGDNFNMTGNSTIICENYIIIGDNCLFSWEDLVMDTDYHCIVENGIKKNITASIEIEDHVWVGCRATILKGTRISRDSVIAAGSIVSNTFKESNSILGGIPAKIMKKGINWEK